MCVLVENVIGKTRRLKKYSLAKKEKEQFAMPYQKVFIPHYFNQSKFANFPRGFLWVSLHEV